jgi:hypothetical protein
MQQVLSLINLCKIHILLYKLKDKEDRKLK